MDKFKVDIEGLDKKLNEPKKIKIANVQHRLEKVGFGVVRFTDEKNKTNLWQVVDNEYIVALYDEPGLTTESWAVEGDKLNKSATVFYKNIPIKSIAYAEYDIKEEDINTFKKVLPQRLATNKDLVSKMINSLDEQYKTEILAKFPELK